MAGSNGAPYAGFARRLGAWLLDSAILLVILLMVSFTVRLLRLMGVWTPVGTTPEETWRAVGVIARLFIVLTFVLSLGPVYFVLFEASPRQATFGKQLLN